jgi:hypothetical protein
MGEYRTSDVHVSAYLQAKGIVRRRVEREGGRFWFIYMEAGPCEQLLEQAYNGQVMLCMPDYWAIEDMLKDIMFGGKRKPRLPDLPFSKPTTTLG